MNVVLAPLLALALQATEIGPDERAALLTLSPLPPPPPDPTNAAADDARAAELGQRLFFDPRLSADGSISCSTCHDPGRGFADGRPLARGRGPVFRHAPSLWNAAYQRWLFWDGRKDSLWAQALAPLEHPDEQDFDRLAAAHLLAGDAQLRAAYEAVFGALPDVSDGARFPPHARPRPVSEGVPENAVVAAPASEELLVQAQVWWSMRADDRAAIERVFSNLGKAIAAYERRLVSRRAPFDVFVEGLREGDASKLDALAPAARRGANLFAGRARCALCHSGPELSDREFHNTRVSPLLPDLLDDRGRLDGLRLLLADPWNSAGAYADAPPSDPAKDLAYLLPEGGVPDDELLDQWKTASLRNVALSPPYMHHGQLATLHDVLRHYATLSDAAPPRGHVETILKPLDLSDAEIDDLVAFLESLTDVSVDPSLLVPPPGVPAPLPATPRAPRVADDGHVHPDATPAHAHQPR